MNSRERSSEKTEVNPVTIITERVVRQSTYFGSDDWQSGNENPRRFDVDFQRMIRMVRPRLLSD